jgi:hypothetical protein
VTVVELPPQEPAGTPVILRRLRGEYEVDEWGLDPDLVRTLLPLARLRWSIETLGAPHLPVDGPALVVYSRRIGVSEQAVLGTAVYRATHRVVRFVGVPDVAPVGPLLRRLGGVLRRADEIAGLLRAGEVVAMEFTLRARGRQGELLKYLGALEPQTDDLGYATCSVPLKIGGTLGNPDPSEVNSKFTALAIERSGFGDKAAELFNKLRGGK